MMEVLEILLTICLIPLMIGISILMFYIIRDVRNGKR